MARTYGLFYMHDVFKLFQNVTMSHKCPFKTDTEMGLYTVTEDNISVQCYSLLIMVPHIHPLSSQQCRDRIGSHNVEL